MLLFSRAPTPGEVKANLFVREDLIWPNKNPHLCHSPLEEATFLLILRGAVRDDLLRTEILPKVLLNYEPICMRVLVFLSLTFLFR